jgi:hypothetical protein
MPQPHTTRAECAPPCRREEEGFGTKPPSRSERHPDIFEERGGKEIRSERRQVVVGGVANGGICLESTVSRDLHGLRYQRGTFRKIIEVHKSGHNRGMSQPESLEPVAAGAASLW